MIIIVFILGGDESVKHRTSAHSVALNNIEIFAGGGRGYAWLNLDNFMKCALLKSHLLVICR